MIRRIACIALSLTVVGLAIGCGPNGDDDGPPKAVLQDTGGSEGDTGTDTGGDDERECLPEGEEEQTCDNLDNDCDGEVDEGCKCIMGETKGCYSGDPETKDVSFCRAGQQTCQSDGTWGDCQDEITPKEEKCDEVDNDCDGTVDETCSCNYKDLDVGVCKDRERAEDGTCPEPTSYEMPTDTETTCQGFDNDCDGVADEGCACDYQMKSDGVCAGQIRQADGTCPEPADFEMATDTESNCDGHDNDCDGVVDEGCSCDYNMTSEGVCAGQTRQADGTCPEPADFEMATDTESNCDGKDNDCDGEVDEGCMP